MENLLENQTNIQEQQLNPVQLAPQKNWGKIGVLVTVALFLATVGVVGLYVLKARRGEELPQPTRLPTPTLAPIFTPTPDPAAGWKSYRDTKYGYSVKYPSTAVVAEHPPAGEERIQETTITFLISPEGGYSGLRIILAIIKNPDQKTPMQFAQEKYNQTKGGIINRSLEGDISKCKIEPVIRSGINGARFTSCTPAVSGGILNFSEWYVKNGVTYEIYAVLYHEDYLTTFDQVLSTFKFLD